MRRRAFLAPLIVMLAAGLGSCASADRDDTRASPPARPAAARRPPGPPSSIPPHTGRVFYVSPTGADTNAGSFRRPFHTIAWALAVVRPGDILFARGGTYHERVKATNIAAGRPDARILFTHFPGERPVIEGQLWLAYPSYWTIDGINVTWARTNPPEHMVQLYGGTGWVLEHAEIWGQGAGTPISKSGLLIGDGDRNDLGSFTVRDNCIHDNETNVYVDDLLQSPAPRGDIERNLIFDAYDGRGIKLGPPGGSGGPKDVVVRYNTIRGGVENISLSRDTTGNLITRNILDVAKQANVGTFDLRGANNVVRDNIASGAPQFSDLAALRGPDDHSGVNPKFDAISCRGFHPKNPQAQQYGRYAPARRSS